MTVGELKEALKDIDDSKVVRVTVESEGNAWGSVLACVDKQEVDAHPNAIYLDGGTPDK